MKNFFKNVNEVKHFFGKEMLKFSFMSDNIIFFDTLAPISLGDEYYNFQLSFYYESGFSFFDYETVKDLIDNFRVSEVQAISMDNTTTITMFFQKYD